MDNLLTNGSYGNNELSRVLGYLKSIAVETNKSLANEVGIQASTAITCIKPSGTVSQLVNCASGIHARHSSYYIRSVRADNKDPLTQFLKDAGIYWEPDVMKPANTTVFFFPIKAPEDAITRNDMTAIEQLEIWKIYQEEWCEHKPSVTISVKENEWPEVGGWVYNNFDMISGISFLPHSDHTYRQAPYDECDEEKYNEFLARMPETLDWNKLQEYEKEDNTSGSGTLACGAGGCEVVDLT